MSTKLYEKKTIRNKEKFLFLTQFYGGRLDDKCLELGILWRGQACTVELTRDEIEELQMRLTNWLKN